MEDQSQSVVCRMSCSPSIHRVTPDMMLQIEGSNDRARTLGGTHTAASPLREKHSYLARAPHKDQVDLPSSHAEETDNRCLFLSPFP
jgi:hypothetical protein